MQNGIKSWGNLIKSKKEDSDEEASVRILLRGLKVGMESVNPETNFSRLKFMIKGHISTPPITYVRVFLKCLQKTDSKLKKVTVAFSKPYIFRPLRR